MYSRVFINSIRILLKTAVNYTEQLSLSLNANVLKGEISFVIEKKKREPLHYSVLVTVMVQVFY